MTLTKILKDMTTTLADRYSRYEQSGSKQPKLDDAQRHWIEVWGLSARD